MNTFNRMCKYVLASTVVVAMMAPAQAQDQGQQGKQQAEQTQQQPKNAGKEVRKSERKNDRQRDQRQAQQRNQRSDRQQYRLQPEGWMRIAYDVNGDGKLDTFEHIYAYDLERARGSSKARMDRDRQTRQQFQRQRMEQRPMRENMRQGSTNAAPGNVVRRVRGTLTALHSQRLAGFEQPHQFARIQTRRGSAKVDLGPQGALSDLSLQEGAQIAVMGTVGTINGRQMLMAHEITKGDQTHVVQRPQATGQRRVKARVTAVRNAVFEGHNHEHTLIDARLVNGRRVTIDLGPSDKLQGITSFEKGDRIAALVTRGKINGKTGLIAREVRKDNKLVQIDRPMQQARLQRSDQQSAKRK